MLELCTLASGSGGNCLLLSDGVTHLLVDAGISARRICTALKNLEIAPADLAGVLITHEHSDHIAGLATLHKQLRLPLYASPGTARELVRRVAQLEPCLHTIAPGDGLTLGAMSISTFATSHDTAESMCYAVSAHGRKAAVVTDLGYVSRAVSDGIAGADLLVVEANHDEQMVRSSAYPAFLKARILGDCGHLSNDAGGALARFAAERGARRIVLAHLSAENNTPQKALAAVGAALADCGAAVLLSVAPRAACGPRYAV